MKLIVLFVIVFYLVESLLGDNGQDAGSAALGDVQQILQIIQNSKFAVVVENQASSPIVLSCASADDKIQVNGNPNPTVAPGQAIGWSFDASLRTQFWCAAVYTDGSKCGGDVYYGGWHDAPSLVHWTIKDSCVALDWNNNARPDIFHNE